MTQPPPSPSLEWAWFFDIDGTLAAIEMSPDAVRIDSVMLHLIATLHEQAQGAVALISGRSLLDIDKLFPGLFLAAAGQHGVERRDAHGQVVRRAVVNDNLIAMREGMAEMERRHAGLLLEDKGLSLALHYRQVPRLGPFIQREVRALYQEFGTGFLLQHGKCVVEVVPVGNTKGTVVTEFMAESPFRGRQPVFLGDDVTDENAFAVVNDLGGYSVKVGAGPTLAQHRLIDVPAVRAWLGSMISLSTVPYSGAGDVA